MGVSTPESPHPVAVSAWIQGVGLSVGSSERARMPGKSIIAGLSSTRSLAGRDPLSRTWFSMLFRISLGYAELRSYPTPRGLAPSRIASGWGFGDVSGIERCEAFKRC